MAGKSKDRPACSHGLHAAGRVTQSRAAFSLNARPTLCFQLPKVLQMTGEGLLPRALAFVLQL